eukprot:scaffold3287_cov274-Chaetoceros_neogracile.AAC.3
MSDCSAWARAVILSSLSDVSPLNCGIGSSEIHAFKLRMIAIWIGGAMFWCDIHLLIERRSDAGSVVQPRWCIAVSFIPHPKGQELCLVSWKNIARDFVYCQL